MARGRANQKVKSELNIILRYSLGNGKTSFTLQSCSKPFTYAVCLNELGSDTVHKYVGQEPSGQMFNELSLDFNSKILNIIP
jgi:glutaminase